MPRLFRALGFLPLVLGAALAAETSVATYRKIQLSDQFFSEGAAFGDFNNDGKMDVVSGPFWYEGPDFKRPHEFYPAAPFDPLKYSDNFLAFVHETPAPRAGRGGATSSRSPSTTNRQRSGRSSPRVRPPSST